MARIRTIKPEFFRHEELQDLAAKHGAHVMLVFAALWGHCDKAGRFEWKPRTLKLDILPFLEFDMGAVLDLLEAAGLMESYTVDGKRYGLIPTFVDHQNIGGKEKEAPAKYPEPPKKEAGNGGGSSGEVTEKQRETQEGKGREEEGNGESARERAPLTPETSPDQNQKPRSRSLWPPERSVPEPWVITAMAERRRLNQPALDLAVVATKFQAHHGAAQNQPRTQAEWQAEWIKFALNERVQGHGKQGQHGAGQSVAARVFGNA